MMLGGRIRSKKYPPIQRVERRKRIPLGARAERALGERGGALRSLKGPFFKGKKVVEEFRLKGK